MIQIDDNQAEWGKAQELSPTICLAKWFQNSLLLQQGLTHSCHHPEPHSVGDDLGLSGAALFHNTGRKLRDRREMLEGGRPKDCSHCWRVEDAGGLSDRSFKSVEDWAVADLEKLEKDPLSREILPKYLEVAFENTCNFACVYCSPQSSSRWWQEAQRFGALPSSDHFNNPEWFRASGRIPRAEAEAQALEEKFWNWWPELRESLVVLRVTGGEPLMSRGLWRLLRELQQNPQPRLRLAINSNLGFGQDRVQKLTTELNGLEGRVARVTVFASLDSRGPESEYTRFGLKLQDFDRNVEALLGDLKFPIRFTVMATIHALGIVGLESLLRWVLELRRNFPQHSIGIDTPHLRYPDFFSLPILPTWGLGPLQRSLEFMEEHSKARQPWGFSDREIKRLERAFIWAKAESLALGEEKRLLAQADCIRVLDALDERRQLDWRRDIPALASLLEPAPDKAPLATGHAQI